MAVDPFEDVTEPACAHRTVELGYVAELYEVQAACCDCGQLLGVLTDAERCVDPGSVARLAEQLGLDPILVETVVNRR